MKRWFDIRHLSIFTKLVLTFFVAVVPMYFASFLINESGRNSVGKEISQSMTTRVHFYAAMLQSEMNRLITLKQQYVIDEELKMLSSIPEGMSDLARTQAILSLQDKLRTMKHSSLYVEEVRLYIPILSRTLYTNDYGYDFPQDDLDAWLQLSPDPFRYRHGRLSLGVVYPEVRYAGADPSFLLEVQLSSRALKEALANIVSPQDGGAVLFGYDLGWELASGDDGGPMIPALRSYLTAGQATGDDGGSSPERLTVDGAKFLVACETLPQIGATLCVHVSEERIFGALDKYRDWLWILWVLSISSILIFSYRMYRVIHRPLRLLMKAFIKVENGNFAGVPRHNNRDEFGYLYEQYNAMIGRIKELIHEVYEQKIRSQRAELKQLQSQINPHFLYNSFFALYQSIQFSGNEPAKRLAQYLGQYFRYLTRTGADDIALEAEWEHAVTYAEIQLIRLSGHFGFECGPLPEPCRGLIVPRLILQPLVENACQYGAEDHPVRGIVRMHARTEGPLLWIAVEDNGEHLPDEALGRLQSRLAAGAGGGEQETTGLINVHRRLQLKFGEAYGLRLSRSSLGGLQVAIYIPIPSEGTPHVSIADRG